MKKIITSLTILVVSLMVMVGSVNAASVVVDPKTTQKISAGQQVKVTVTADGQGAQYKVAYDTSKFTFEKDKTMEADNTILSINSDYHGTGELYVVALSTTHTLIFTAKEDITTSAELPFTIKELVSDGADDVASVPSTLTITPATPTPTPDPTPDPTPKEPIDPKGDGKDKDSDEKYIDDNGNEITEITQAGNTYFVGVAIALVALVGGALVVRKIRK